MKKWLLPIAVIFFGWPARAQVGITLSPTYGFSPDWQIAVENFITHRRTPFLNYGVTATLDYDLPTSWAPLSFRPALHGTRSTVSYNQHRFEVVGAGLQANLNLSLLSSAPEAARRTALVLQLSPGLDYLRQRYDRPGQDEDLSQRFSNHGLAPSAGANLLLECQLTSLLHVAPQAGLRYYPALTWDGFTAAVTRGQLADNFDRTTWRQVTFGVRIGLNLQPAAAK